MSIELFRLVAGMLVLLSPFIAISMAMGCIVGRVMTDPAAASVTGGLVGLTLFWSSLVTALVVVLDGDEGAGVAFLVNVLLAVALFVSPLYGALAFAIWRTKRRRTRAR